MPAPSRFVLGLGLALVLAAPAASRAQPAAPATAAAAVARTPDEAALLAADARQRDAVEDLGTVT